MLALKLPQLAGARRALERALKLLHRDRVDELVEQLGALVEQLGALGGLALLASSLVVPPCVRSM